MNWPILVAVKTVTSYLPPWVTVKWLPPRSSNPNYRIPVRISSESDKIRQDSVEFCAHLVGSEGRNPIIRIPATFERTQPELFEADRIRSGVIDLGGYRQNGYRFVPFTVETVTGPYRLSFQTSEPVTVDR
jgi:hypothetical protein